MEKVKTQKALYFVQKKEMHNMLEKERHRERLDILNDRKRMIKRKRDKKG